MKKHIKEALRAAGLPLTTPVERTGRNHLAITVGSVRVTASATPSCPYAGLKITRDLVRAIQHGNGAPGHKPGDRHA